MNLEKLKRPTFWCTFSTAWCYAASKHLQHMQPNFCMCALSHLAMHLSWSNHSWRTNAPRTTHTFPVAAKEYSWNLYMDRVSNPRHAKFEVIEKKICKKTKKKILHLSSCRFNCSSPIRNSLLLIATINKLISLIYFLLHKFQLHLKFCMHCPSIFFIKFLDAQI